MVPKKTKPSRRRLSHEDFYHLAHFLEDNRKDLTGLTYVDIGVRASKHFGRDIATLSIRECCKMVGLVPVNKSKPTDQILVVAKAVEALYTKLKEPVPATLKTLIDP